MHLLKGDPRYFQICALFALFSGLFFMSDFAPSVEVLALNVMACFATQMVCYKIFIPDVDVDFRSPLITSLSLTLLLKTSVIWLVPVAAILAMASKFTLRVNDKHLFNPANFGIVVLLLFLPDQAWISPAQWGKEIWLAFLLACLALPVLGNAKRFDTAIFFIVIYGGMLLARNLWLGDPLAILTNQLLSGALLIFTFFMITDPKSTPNHVWGRLLFAALVAVLAYIMTFVFQIREAIFFALFGACLTTPLIDIVFKSSHYQWGKPQ